MALPPTIPTSFVPHPSGGSGGRAFRSDFSGAFAFFAYGVLALVFLLCLGVFFYSRFLANDKANKDAQIAQKEAEIDSKTVESFVRLRNRLTSGRTMLDKHTALSKFYSILEQTLPTTVRFTSLHLSLDSTDVPRVDASGVARSFNALAAASQAFAADGRIKDAIFSRITVNNKDGTVSFTLSALLDPKTVTFSL